MEKGEEQRRVRGNDGNTNVPNTVIKKESKKGNKNRIMRKGRNE